MSTVRTPLSELAASILNMPIEDAAKALSELSGVYYTFSGVDPTDPPTTPDGSINPWWNDVLRRLWMYSWDDASWKRIDSGGGGAQGLADVLGVDNDAGNQSIVNLGTHLTAQNELTVDASGGDLSLSADGKISASNQQIRDVANGTTDDAAVNVGQLNALTLQQVTDAGAVTTNDITVGDVGAGHVTVSVADDNGSAVFVNADQTKHLALSAVGGNADDGPMIDAGGFDLTIKSNGIDANASPIINIGDVLLATGKSLTLHSPSNDPGVVSMLDGGVLNFNAADVRATSDFTAPSLFAILDPTDGSSSGHAHLTYDADKALVQLYSQDGSKSLTISCDNTGSALQVNNNILNCQLTQFKNAADATDPTDLTTLQQQQAADAATLAAANVFTDNARMMFGGGGAIVAGQALAYSPSGVSTGDATIALTGYAAISTRASAMRNLYVILNTAPGMGETVTVDAITGGAVVFSVTISDTDVHARNTATSDRAPQPDTGAYIYVKVTSSGGSAATLASWGFELC